MRPPNNIPCKGISSDTVNVWGGTAQLQMSGSMSSQSKNSNNIIIGLSIIIIMQVLSQA